jgi:hypothetical protein
MFENYHYSLFQTYIRKKDITLPPFYDSHPEMLPPDNFFVVAPSPFRSSLLKRYVFGEAGE